MQELMKLTSIIDSISEENAAALENGVAEVSIKPVEVDGNHHLVIYVNEQAVFAPVAVNSLDTYTNCAEQIERYMNSY